MTEDEEKQMARDFARTILDHARIRMVVGWWIVAVVFSVVILLAFAP